MSWPMWMGCAGIVVAALSTIGLVLSQRRNYRRFRAGMPECPCRRCRVLASLANEDEQS